MAGKNDKKSNAATKNIDAEIRLASLQQRSQADFEIEFFERIALREPNYVEVLTCLGELFSEKKLYRRALKVDLRLSLLRPQNSTVMYNLACTYALLNQSRKALAALRRACELGFDEVSYLLDDSDLDSLRHLAEFRRLIINVCQKNSGPHIL